MQYHHLLLLCCIICINSGFVLAQDTENEWHVNDYSYLFESSLADSIIINKFLLQHKTQQFYVLPIKEKEKYFRRALEISRSLADSTFYIKMLNEVSEFRKEVGDFKTAKALSDEVLDLAKLYSMSDVLINTYYRLSFINRRRGNFEQALHEAQLMLKTAQEANNKPEIIHAYDTIAAMNQRLHQTHLALKNLLSGLILAEKIKNYAAVSTMHTRIGKIYLMVKEPDKALSHRLKAVEFAKLSEDSLIIATAKHRLGDCYLIFEKYDTALALYEDALAYRKENARKDRYAQVLRSIGELHLQQNQFEKAASNFKKAIPHFEVMNHNYMLSDLYFNTGISYFNQGKIDSAQQAYEKALAYIDNDRRFELYTRIYKGLSDIAFQEKEFSEAYHYLSLHLVAKDSMQFDEQVKLTAYNEAKFEFDIEKSEQEAAFDAMLLVKEEQIKSRNTFITGFIMFSIITSGLLLLLYRSRNRQNQSLAVIKNQNENIQQQNKSLEELNEVKNNYFTILAHDLRTPFGTILQLSEILNKYSPEKQWEDFREITDLLENSSIQFNKLLESTLEWGRLQMNGISLSKELLNLYEEIGRMFSFLEGSARLKEITLTNRIPENTEAYSDRDILQGVVNNLLTNAIKFTDHGGEVWVTTEKTVHDSIKISVADNGVGIKKEKLKTIFSLGKQSVKNGTAGEEGSGFGLINSKKMIELNGGELTIESEEGKGTTVSFTLERACKNSPSAQKVLK